MRVLWGADLKLQRLINVARGTATTDAATVAQVNEAVDAIFKVITVGTRAAVEAARDSVASGGYLYFSPGVTFDWTGFVVFDPLVKPGLTLTGTGNITGGLKIGTGSQGVGVKIEARYKLDGLRMNRPLDTTTYPGTSGDGTSANPGTPKGYAAGSSQIQLDRVRTVEIMNCDISGSAYPIFILPNANCGQHELSAIKVHHNNFNECDEAIHSEYDAAAPGGWQCWGDSAFDDNTINKSYVRMFGIQAIDGFHFTGNVHFMINYSGTSYTNQQFKRKRQNGWIGEAGWVHCDNNALFEAGYESLLIEKAHNLVTITSGNHFGWPGQVVPSDAVRVTANSNAGYPSLIVEGNSDEFPSKSFLSAAGNFVSIALGPNTHTYDTTQNDAAAGRYIGVSETSYAQRKATLDALPHYRYDLGEVTYPKAPQITITGVPSERDGASDRLPGAGGTPHPYTTSARSTGGSTSLQMVESTAYVSSVTFTALQTKDICQIRGGGEAFSVWGGKVTVEVEKVGGTRLATYELLVSKSAAGLECFQMGVTPLAFSTGETADDPSFTFDVNANGLTATGLKNTVGSFVFLMRGTGDLIVG